MSTPGGLVHQVKVGSATYEIPDIWLAGFCTANKCSVADAIAWWHQQQLMEEASNDVPAGTV